MLLSMSKGLISDMPQEEITIKERETMPILKISGVTNQHKFTQSWIVKEDLMLIQCY